MASDLDLDINQDINSAKETANNRCKIVVEKLKLQLHTRFIGYDSFKLVDSYLIAFKFAQ